jgi:hypothetical protein
LREKQRKKEILSNLLFETVDKMDATVEAVQKVVHTVTLNDIDG